MEILQKTLAAIPGLDERAMDYARAHWNSIQAGQLGELAELVVQAAGISGKTVPDIRKKCMILAAADHGVARQGVSAYPIETTIHMTKNYLIPKGAGANALANYCHADMVVVDVGIAADMSGTPGLIDRKIAWGTKDFTVEPAMTKEQAVQAIETGIEIVEEQIKKGYRVFSVGEMGIGNTTSAAAMVCVFCGLSAEEATGRGTNISDQRLIKKVDIVRKAVALHQPDKEDGLAVIAALGGFELAALTGVMLGAAANHSLVIIDGFNATAAALGARALCKDVTGYIMASHLSAEKAHQRALKELGLHSYIDLGFRLGEASGASIQMKMLDCAIQIYQDTHPVGGTENDK